MKRNSFSLSGTLTARRTIIARRTLTARRTFIALLLAGTIGMATLSCGLFDSSSPLPEPGQELELTAVVLFATGSVTADGQPIRSGSILKSGQLLKTGPRSFCDLQVRQTDSGAMIRVKENSEFELSGRKFEDRKDIVAELKKGDGMFDLNKISAEENFQSASPTAVAAVRGTKYSMSVRGDKTSIEVFDGSVATRPRMQALEDLPPEVRERSRVVNETLKGLEEKEVVLESGNRIEVQAVKVDPELEKAIQEAAAVEGEDPQSAEKAAQKLDEALEERKPALQKQVQEVAPAKPAQISDPEMKQKLEEYNELIRIEKEKIQGENVSEAVNERNAKNQQKLMQRIEKVFNKPSETLVLMNGGRVSGVVIQIGSTYYVYTVNGQVAYPESQVAGIEF